MGSKVRIASQYEGMSMEEVAEAQEAVPGAAGHESIIFELEGLRQVNPNCYGNEKPRFELSGIPQVHIDYSRINEALTEQGIGQALADEAIDGMAEFIFARMLGEILAKKMKRVG